MYDNLDELIVHKRFAPTPRPYPSARLNDFAAVEPWQKTTLEIDIINDSVSHRQAKTFYRAPTVKTHERHYTTHRGFGLRKETTRKEYQKPKSLAEFSKRSAINQYNISGNILNESMRQAPKALPFELPSKRVRVLKPKEKLSVKNLDQVESFPICQSVMAMKRRINSQRERAGQNFLLFNMQNGQEAPKNQLVPKRSKILNVGYQKLARTRVMKESKSVQLRISPEPY